MAQNRQMGAGMMPPPASPANPTAVNFQSDPNMRQQFKGFMSGLSKKMEQQQPAMQAPLPMPMPMQNVDIFQPMPMAMGGSVPRSTNIAGQPHMLSYITPGEAGVLQAMGGSGAPGPGGIPSFFFGGGDYSDPYESEGTAGTTNFSSGNGSFSSDDGDSGSTTGLNLTYADGTPAGVAISGNVITGGTIKGGDDPVAAGFGGGSSSGVDDSAEFLGIPQFGIGPRPFAQMSRTVIPSTVDITDDLRAGASRDALSSALSSAQRSMLNDAYAQQARAELSSPVTGPLSVPSSLSSPEKAYDYDVDLLGLNMDPQREMGLLQDAARGQDYTDRFGSAIVPEGFGSSRPSVPQTPMVADFARLNPATIEQINRENLARSITNRGGQIIQDELGNIIEQNPVTGEAVGSVPSPIAMPSEVVARRDANTIQSSFDQPGFESGKAAGERVAQGQPSGQVEAPVGPFPESTYEIDGIAPPPGQSAAEVQAAINAARATGDSAFTRQSEIGRLADLMDRRTTVTLADPKNRPGRVDPNTGLPINVGATSVSSLEQLGRRAGRGSQGISGLVEKLTGFNPAASMYQDIVNNGFSPIYDSRGQIIGTVNPETGRLGKGSRSIDMNAISETGGDLNAFIYNQFADQSVFGGGDDGGQPIRSDLLKPSKPDTEEPGEDEDDDVVGGPTPPPVVIPPFQTGEAAKVTNPLGFGYGQYTPTSSNLESSVDKFIKMLGG